MPICPIMPPPPPRLAGGGAGEGGIAEVASCELGQIGVSSFASDPQVGQMASLKLTLNKSLEIP